MANTPYRTLPTVTPSLSIRLTKLALALVAGTCVGWGIQQGIAWWRSQPAADVPQTFQQPLYAAPAASAPVSAWLLLGGQRHSLDQGQVALPSGSRFQIELESRSVGQLTLATVTPAGQPMGAIWSSPVAAGVRVVTPILRLEGTKGPESLQIMLQPASGGPIQVRTVHLWHL